MVKPVDSGAGIGITVCHNFDQLYPAIDRAKQSSRSGRFLLEKYMRCADMSAYYTFIDGSPVLTATTDRFTSNVRQPGSPVCIGASYPSHHEEAFLSQVHPKLLDLFASLDIRFGVFNLQLFYDGNEFYAYDPGFRLQGEGYHFHILDQSGIDQRKMLIDYALGNTHDFSSALSQLSHFRLCTASKALTIWVLLKEGCIAHISGLNEINSLDACVHVLQRFDIGDSISSSMLGTEKQVFCRIYLHSPTIDSLRSAASSVNEPQKFKIKMAIV